MRGADSVHLRRSVRANIRARWTQAACPPSPTACLLASTFTSFSQRSAARRKRRKTLEVEAQLTRQTALGPLLEG